MVVKDVINGEEGEVQEKKARCDGKEVPWLCSVVIKTTVCNGCGGV